MAHKISRRAILKSSAALGVIGVSQSLLPGWMPRMAFSAQAQTPQHDTLVCIFLRGGMDGLSIVAPFGEGAAYFDARPTIAIPEPGSSSDAAINLDGFFGLHPALFPLKEIYDESDLLLVHATGSIDPTRSHFDAMRFMEYGVPGDKSTSTGWLGRHLQTAAWQNESPFRAVGMGAMLADSLRGPVSPLSLQSIADFHFRGRADQLRRLQASLSQLYAVQAPTDALGKQAGLVFETIDTLKGIQSGGYQPAAGAEYPDGEFGMGLQQIAQLIKADVGLEVACLDLDGWDTHENQGTNGGGFAELAGTLGRGLHAFYTDLRERMGNITVVAMSEFGRRVGENGSNGTDHGHGNVMFLLGGGVKGGQVYTRWPTLAPTALDDGDLAITTDYRAVLAELLRTRLNNSATADIFPDFDFSPLGLFHPLENA